MKWVKNKTIDQNKNDLNLVLRIGRTNVALKSITLYLHWKNDQIKKNLRIYCFVEIITISRHIFTLNCVST